MKLKNNLSTIQAINPLTKSMSKSNNHVENKFMNDANFFKRNDIINANGYVKPKSGNNSGKKSSVNGSGVKTVKIDKDDHVIPSEYSIDEDVRNLNGTSQFLPMSPSKPDLEGQ